MLILGYFGHFPYIPKYPNSGTSWKLVFSGILAFPGILESGISWNPGIWHILETGILILPGWCYISSEYMIYRKCLYTVYLYCLKVCIFVILYCFILLFFIILKLVIFCITGLFYYIDAVYWLVQLCFLSCLLLFSPVE